MNRIHVNGMEGGVLHKVHAQVIKERENMACLGQIIIFLEM